MIVFLFFTFKSGSLQESTIFRCKTFIYVYIVAVYLGWLFTIYFCINYFELIRCNIPYFFTLTVKIYPVPFFVKENDNRGIGLWWCTVGNINLVWMKAQCSSFPSGMGFQPLQPSKKFASIVLIIMLKLILKVFFNWLCCSLPAFWFSCSDSIELFRFLFSRYNFLLSLISCCIFSFCSWYFSESRPWLASRLWTVFFISLISL